VPIPVPISLEYSTQSRTRTMGVLDDMALAGREGRRERHRGRLTSGSAVVEDVPERGYTDATSELPFGFALGQPQDAQHQTLSPPSRRCIIDGCHGLNSWSTAHNSTSIRYLLCHLCSDICSFHPSAISFPCNLQR
jgi:hypothetical protein